MDPVKDKTDQALLDPRLNTLPADVQAQKGTSQIQQPPSGSRTLKPPSAPGRQQPPLDPRLQPPPGPRHPPIQPGSDKSEPPSDPRIRPAQQQGAAAPADPRLAQRPQPPRLSSLPLDPRIGRQSTDPIQPPASRKDPAGLRLHLFQDPESSPAPRPAFLQHLDDPTRCQSRDHENAEISKLVSDVRPGRQQAGPAEPSLVDLTISSKSGAENGEPDSDAESGEISIGSDDLSEHSLDSGEASHVEESEDDDGQASHAPNVLLESIRAEILAQPKQSKRSRRARQIGPGLLKTRDRQKQVQLDQIDLSAERIRVSIAEQARSSQPREQDLKSGLQNAPRGASAKHPRAQLPRHKRDQVGPLPSIPGPKPPSGIPGPRPPPGIPGPRPPAAQIAPRPPLGVLKPMPPKGKPGPQPPAGNPGPRAPPGIPKPRPPSGAPQQTVGKPPPRPLPGVPVLQLPGPRPPPRPPAGVPAPKALPIGVLSEVSNSAPVQRPTANSASGAGSAFFTGPKFARR